MLGFKDMSTLVGHFVSSPREREKMDRTRAVVGQRSSPAGYILYCNIFIIKPYNIGHTDLDVFVCKSFCHRYNNPGMTILHEIVIKI